MRLGRLFWKLFAAFTLATSASFFIGINFVEFLKPRTGGVAQPFEKPVQIASVIQNRGLGAALPLLRADEPIGRIGLFTRGGDWVAGSHNIDSGAQGIDVSSPDGATYRLRIRPSDPLDPRLTLPLLIGTLVSLFFSAGLAWYLARPLTHLSRGFREVAAGQLSTRLHSSVGARRDEIADLTREFDSMAAQLEALLDAQERILHAISHELRSPLARLQVAIGLLSQTPENLPEMLARVDREAQQLDRLIEEILTLARLKSGMVEHSTTRIDVIDLLTAIVDDANFEAQAKGCEVRFNPSASFVTMAYGELLYRAYENVIRNAVKFSPEMSPIDVWAIVRDERLLVEVTDRGPGVPPDMLSEMFEPFKSLENSEATGFGLGLAIAKYSVDQHGGTIRAKRGPQGTGLVVQIELPMDSNRRRH